MFNPSSVNAVSYLRWQRKSNCICECDMHTTLQDITARGTTIRITSVWRHVRRNTLQLKLLVNIITLSHEVTEHNITDIFK